MVSPRFLPFTISPTMVSSKWPCRRPSRTSRVRRSRAWSITGLSFVGITSFTALALQVVDQSLEVFDGRGIRQRPHRPLVVEEGQHGVAAVRAILESKHRARAFPTNPRQPEAVAAQVAGEVEVRSLEDLLGFCARDLRYLLYPVWLKH